MGPLRGYGEVHGDDEAGEISVLIENGEAALDLSEPGVFGAVISDVSAEAQDGQRLSIPEIPLGDQEITAADLAAGMKDIVVKPLGVLHVTVIDEAEHNPVPGATLGLRWENCSATDTVYTDEKGTYTFLALQEGRYSVMTGGGSDAEVEIVGGRRTDMTIVTKQPKS